MKKPHAYITNTHFSHSSLNRMIAVTATTFGVIAIVLSGAPRAYAATATDTYSPASQTVATGSNFTVTVNTNVGANHALTDQLRVTFNAAKLQYVSVSYSGSALDNDAPDAGAGAGYFQISRYTLGTKPTGTFLLAKITFKALATSGTDTLGYDAANSSVYIQEDSGAADALTGVSGATYTFDGIDPAVSITAPANGATISGSTTVSGTATDASGVSRVEFSIDGSIFATDTSSPYSAGLNSASYTNGAHTLAAKAYDGVGRSATSSVSVTINNATSSGSGGTSGSTTKPPTTGTTTTPTATTPTGTSSQPLSADTPAPVSAGNGVETTGQYTVASLADKKVVKSKTSLFAIVGISIAAVGAVAGGIILRNIIVRKRDLMRHISAPSAATAEPVFEPGQAPIAPSNIPHGTVVQPSNTTAFTAAEPVPTPELFAQPGQVVEPATADSKPLFGETTDSEELPPKPPVEPTA